MFLTPANRGVAHADDLYFGFMLHDTISNALNEQIGLEGQSSHTYLTMAVWAETQGFDGVAEFLYTHSEEERQHMLKLMRFVNERGGVAGAYRSGRGHGLRGIEGGV